MTVPFPLSAAGADLNDVIAAVNELRAFSGCRIALNVTQSVPNLASTPIALDTQLYDTDDYWVGGAYSFPAGTGPNFFRMPFDGYYQAIVHAAFFPNAAGSNRNVDFHEWGPVLDGSIQTSGFGVPGDQHVSLVTHFYAPAGQKIDINVFQDSGGALALQGKTGAPSTGRYDTFVAFHYLGASG